ncbi:MAG: serine hydrolase domain-containing protein [Verrucomicrobiota bacterium]
MSTRRDFLKLAGLATCSGCASVSTSGNPWSHREIEILEATAGRNAARGWAAWQGNRQVASWTPDARGPSLSITKSIAALAASRAAAEGWLAPNEKVADTISEWRGDPSKSRITVLMLLQQTSGLEAGVIPLYRNYPADKGRAAISLRSVDAPGSVFRYGPGHWEVLAEVMKRRLSAKRESLADFMKRSVMRPIGLSPYNWRSDKSDTPYFSTGTELSVTELGRLGKALALLLDGKDTDGLSSTHFAEMSRPSSVNPMFGGGLWRNSNAARASAFPVEVEKSIDSPLPASFWNRACLSTRQPAGLVALIGSGGKRVYIWPGDEKRIARLGSSTSWNDAYFLSSLAP